jgi:Transcriptional regulator
MSDRGRPARERGSRAAILDAAISIAREEGISAVSVRAVAQRAGVNLALISYHFGSKGALMEEVLATLLEELSGDLDSNLKRAVLGGGAEGSSRPREALLDFASAMWSFLEKNERLYREVFSGVVASGRAPPPLGDFLRGSAIRGLSALLSAAGGRPVDEYGAVQFASAILLPRLLGRAFADIAGVDLATTEAAEAYRRELVDRYCLHQL